MKSIANSVLSHFQVTLYLIGIASYRDKYVSRGILATKRFDSQTDQDEAHESGDSG